MEQIIIEMIEKAKESQDFDLLTFAFNIIEELASTTNAPSDWRSIGEKLVVRYLYEVGERPEEHEKEEVKYFNFAIVIGRRNGTEDIIGFTTKESALTVFHAFESVAVHDAENIETLSFEIHGIRTKEIHY